MKVSELIKELQKMPQDARVFHLWDGEPRTAINIVYEDKIGNVITSDYGQVCYSTNPRPKHAPTSEENRYWETPKNPKGEFIEELYGE